VDLPAPVADTVRAHLRALDDAVPGLVEGLYLTGSVAMGDFRRGRGPTGWAPSGAARSDVDFVAVTRERPDGAAVAALAGVHRGLAVRGRPPVEGVYLTRDDLAGDPVAATGLVRAHGGRVDRDGAGHPVLWQEVAQLAVAVRGPHRDELDVRTDRDALVAWVRGNLDGYWRRWHGRCDRPLSVAGVLGLTHWLPVWGVLGVSRLHHTVATGSICSKTAGGRYALDAFDARWHRVVHECLRIRTARGGLPRYANPVARRRDALDFVAMVIAAGTATA
jgi:aminoglycoside adenylyltransferase-like protein